MRKLGIVFGVFILLAALVAGGFVFYGIHSSNAVAGFAKKPLSETVDLIEQVSVGSPFPVRKARTLQVSDDSGAFSDAVSFAGAQSGVRIDFEAFKVRPGINTDLDHAIGVIEQILDNHGLSLSEIQRIQASQFGAGAMEVRAVTRTKFIKTKVQFRGYYFFKDRTFYQFRMMYPREHEKDMDLVWKQMVGSFRIVERGAMPTFAGPEGMSEGGPTMPPGMKPRDLGGDGKQR